MTQKKPINVEAQRVNRLIAEYNTKLKTLAFLNQDFFVEVRKRPEEDLKLAFGNEAGMLLASEAFCEENFQGKNTKVSEKMEPLDSENFDAREKREARTNAYLIKNNIMKLIRIFNNKRMQDKLMKEFPNLPRAEIGFFNESFENIKSLWDDRLTTPLEEANKIKFETE